MTNEIETRITELENTLSANPVTVRQSKRDMFEVMEFAEKFAARFANSKLVPTHYRNNPDDCFIALQSAYRMGIDPMLYMQNTYVVNGKLGMATQFAIALANISGLFGKSITHKIEGEGNDIKAIAYATLKNGDVISYTVSMQMAIADGWTKNAKYKSLPGLMLFYRAATLLIRTHVPEVLNGLHTVEELEDVAALAKDVTPKQNGSRVEQLKSNLSEKILKEVSNHTEAQGNNQSSIPESTDKEVKNELEEQQKCLEKDIQKLLELIDKHKISADTINKWLDKANVPSLFALDQEKVNSILKYIDEKYS